MKKPIRQARKTSARMHWPWPVSTRLAAWDSPAAVMLVRFGFEVCLILPFAGVPSNFMFLANQLIKQLLVDSRQSQVFIDVRQDV